LALIGSAGIALAMMNAAAVIPSKVGITNNNRRKKYR
jgi:hypothetical protein